MNIPVAVIANCSVNKLTLAFEQSSSTCSWCLGTVQPLDQSAPGGWIHGPGICKHRVQIAMLKCIKGSSKKRPGLNYWLQNAVEQCSAETRHSQAHNVAIAREKRRHHEIEWCSGLVEEWKSLWKKNGVNMIKGIRQGTLKLQQQSSANVSHDPGMITYVTRHAGVPKSRHPDTCACEKVGEPSQFLICEVIFRSRRPTLSDYDENCSIMHPVRISINQSTRFWARPSAHAPIQPWSRIYIALRPIWSTGTVNASVSTQSWISGIRSILQSSFLILKVLLMRDHPGP